MKIVKSSCSSKRKVRTCTFSPQVNIKNKRTAIQTEQDVNAAHSEAKIQDLIDDIRSNIYTKVKAVATSPDFGFDENEVDDYFFVEVSATEIGEDHHEAIRVEVRAEVSYEGLEDLMEALNPIIESYDSYAYFEPVEPGIIEAYVSVDQIDMSIYGATASSDDSIMFEGNNYEYVTNNDGYWIYRAVIDGKGVWRAMKQGSDESQFDKLSFPISYEQARGFDAIGEPSSISKLRKDLGKMLLPNASTSVHSATNDGEGYWFFTTHGVQPGSIPRDVDILDIIDTPNGSFVKFDRFLSTEELNEYDMKERAPKSVMSSKESDVRLDDTVGIYSESDESDESDELRSEDDHWVQEIEWAMSDLPSWFKVKGDNLHYKVTYNNQTVDVEFSVYDIAKYTYYINGDGPYTTNQAERIGEDIENYIDGTDVDDVFSETEYDEEYDEGYDEERAEDNPWVQQIAYTMSSEMPPWFTVQGDNLEYDVTYNGQTVHVEFFLFEGAKYTYYIDGDGPYTTNQSEEIEQDIEDYIDEQQEDITSATEEDEEGLPMVDQEYDSAATSINSNKLPSTER